MGVQDTTVADGDDNEVDCGGWAEESVEFVWR